MKLSLKIIKNILLAFVLISIGFALGKHFSAPKITADPAGKAASSVVMVYYMHGTMRCFTCNRIEEMTKELLYLEYSDRMDAGKIEFADIDFEKDKALAKRFDVTGSCVVVADIQAGKIVSWKRLDKVWELFRNTVKFNTYISDAIEAYLNPQENAK